MRRKSNAEHNWNSPNVQWTPWSSTSVMLLPAGGSRVAPVCFSTCKSTLRRLTPHRQLKVLHFTLIFNYFCRAFILCPHGACIALLLFNIPLLLSLISSLDFLFTLCCAFILNQSLFVSAGKKWKPKADPRSKAGSLLADEINCSRAKKEQNIYLYISNREIKGVSVCMWRETGLIGKRGSAGSAGEGSGWNVDGGFKTNGRTSLQVWTEKTNTNSMKQHSRCAGN